MAKYWMGSTPQKCDLCDEALHMLFIDGATKEGPWANMCPRCHQAHGVGLGTGRGQKYERQKDQNRWLKVAG